MIDLINRHYEAIKARNLITDRTKTIDFLDKILEEDREMIREIYTHKTNPNNKDALLQEIIDSIMPRIHLLRHLGADLELELMKNVIKQEHRTKK